MGTRFMKHHRWVWLGVVGLALVFASSPVAASPKRHMHKPSTVKVMTRNLYLGADIFRVVEAAQTDPATIPYAVAQVFGIMQQTDFPERAEAIADEILKTKPDVIGIQEASTYYIQTPGDFLAGNPVQADTVVIDFYSVLNAALKARGLHYKAYAVTNADIELPMVDPTAGPPYYLSDVRLVDHDMILVRKGLRSWPVTDGNYTTQLEMDLGGTTVAFSRGYLVVDAKIDGKAYRCVNTHLEVASAPGSLFRYVQSEQMLDLLGIIDDLAADGPKQVIMVGDLNSSPEDVPGEAYHPAYNVWLPYTPPYMTATEAGFMDAWLLQKHHDEGYTSGFDELVSDPEAQLTERIDHIFIGPDGYTVDKVKAVVVGDAVRDMTPGGLWPSDHAGVVARIRFSRQR